MNEQLQKTIDEAPRQRDIEMEEKWDIYRLTQEVAALCAKHLDGAAIFACAPNDGIADHVAVMVGGAEADDRVYGDMLKVIGGKLFQLSYGMHSEAQTVVHRERGDLNA